jgi:hypothetical protein
MEFIDACVADSSSTMDVFTYDLNEPAIIEKFSAMKNRLR